MERLYTYIKRNFRVTKKEVFAICKQVLVNKKPAKPTTIIYKNDVITYQNKIVYDIPYQYYLYNKEIGLECTWENKKNSFCDLKIVNKLFSVGRLDKDSHGLLLLTNDGKFANSLASSSMEKEKEYLVWVNKEITSTFLNDLKKGVIINKNYLTKETIVIKLDAYCFSITLKEGKNRQIRKMCKTLGYRVEDLLRIRLDDFLLMDLKEKHFQKIDI